MLLPLGLLRSLWQYLGAREWVLSAGVLKPNRFQREYRRLVAGGDRGLPAPPAAAPAQHEKVRPAPPPARPGYLFLRKYSSRSPDSLA